MQPANYTVVCICFHAQAQIHRIIEFKFLNLNFPFYYRFPYFEELINIVKEQDT